VVRTQTRALQLSTVEIGEMSVRSFTTRGLDGIDGTPVLDIKPVFRWSVPKGELRVASWSEELGENYF
jgi:tRNA (Thr-GGU) A37 N-methylase